MGQFSQSLNIRAFIALFTPSEKRHSVAVVDDETSLCRLYSVVLKKNGYDVVFTGRSGEEILAAIARGELTRDNFDTALLDYRLGSGIDGIETARRISKLIASVKIIIITADDSVKAQVLAAGFSFIAKPFSLQEFLKCLVKEEGESGLRKKEEETDLSLISTR